EDVERRRPGREDRQEQAYRHQRPLATGEQRQPLDLLARWPRLDIEAGGEHVLGISEDQAALPAGEQSGEHALELHGDVVVRLGEDPLDPLVDLADDVEQVALGPLQVLQLRREKRVPLLQGGELLQSQRVDLPQRGQPPLTTAEPLLLGLTHVGMWLWRLRQRVAPLRRRLRNELVRSELLDEGRRVDTQLLSRPPFELLDAQPLLRARHLVAVDRVGELAQLLLEDGDLAAEDAELRVPRGAGVFRPLAEPI